MWLQLVALTIPLCLDSFLIAAAIGISRPPHRQRIRIGLLFALFEAGTPLVGLLVGRSLSSEFGDFAQYIAITVLAGVGVYALVRPSGAEDAKAQKFMGAHGLTLFALGLSISLDGLAIGFTYGLLKLPVVAVTILIALQAFVFSQLGFAVGSRLPERLRQMGEKLAGIILILIGVILLAEHFIS